MRVKVGVVGAGYWGPNIIRNFFQTSTCQMAVACDLDPQRLKYIGQLYPTVSGTTDYDDMLSNGSVDAVAICTNVAHHYPLAKKALEAGKHVLIEKPITTSSDQAKELIDLANKKKLTLMVDHTLQYTAAVDRTKQLIEEGVLGEVLYAHCARLNLGIFQPDVNVVWDLAPHDLSFFFYATGLKPQSVQTVGMKLMHPKVEDVATVTVTCTSGARLIMHVSWVDPGKVRMMSFVGSKQMLVFDDLSQFSKLQVYDKYVQQPPHYDSFGEFLCSYHYGDIHMLRLQEKEPLSVVCRHFIDCIETGQTPRSDGISGLEVVRILEASDRSIAAHGAEVAV